MSVEIEKPEFDDPSLDPFDCGCAKWLDGHAETCEITLYLVPLFRLLVKYLYIKHSLINKTRSIYRTMPEQVRHAMMARHPSCSVIGCKEPTEYVNGSLCRYHKIR